MQTGDLRLKWSISPAVVTAGRSFITTMAVLENFTVFYWSRVRLILSSSKMPLYSKQQMESKVCLSPHCFSVSNTHGAAVSRLH